MAVICYLSGSNIVPFSDALSDETYIEHNQDGNDVLVFFVDTKNPVYRQIHEETVVQFGDNNYVVKKIQDDKFEAFVDLDFLKATYHAGKYSTGTKTLEQQIRSMLDNTWTINFTDGSTYGNAVIEIEDGTNYDIMQACMNAYGCYFVWKTLLKTVEVYSHTNQSSSGKYLTKELNLESVDFQGDTTELVTRLYPRGKDDTTIVGATVTNDQIQQYGLIQGTHYNSSLKYIADYVECHDYTDKVLCGSLSDDRFTDSTNLLAYALKQVAKSAMPVRSYECSVINLAKQNPEYAFLTIQLHSTITLIDNERGINVDHRVVKYIEYPDNRARDKVTLSTVPDDITNTIEKVASSVRIDTDKIVSDMDAAIQHATDLITSATGGYLMLKDTDNDGKPDELVISDKSDPTDSTAKVWRFNKNGLAHSSNGYGGTYSDAAITMDGHVVADRIAAHSITSDMISTEGLSAGVITAGTLQSSNLVTSFNLTSGFLKTGNIQVTGGTIKIGGSNYYTYIADGSLRQYFVSSGGLIGGLVPAGEAYQSLAETLYYDDGQNGVDVSRRNSDGTFNTIAKFTTEGINLYTDALKHYCCYDGYIYECFYVDDDSFYFRYADTDAKQQRPYFQANTSGLYYSTLEASSYSRHMRSRFYVTQSTANIDVNSRFQMYAGNTYITSENGKMEFCDGTRYTTLEHLSKALIKNTDVSVSSICFNDGDIAFQVYNGELAFGIQAQPMSFWARYYDFKGSDIRIQGTGLAQWIKNNLSPKITVNGSTYYGSLV